MLAQLPPDVQLDGEWSIEASGDGWSNLLLLWLLAAALFYGLSLLFNHLPISSPRRSLTRKGARPQNDVPDSAPAGEPAWRPLPGPKPTPVVLKDAKKEKRSSLRRKGK